MITRREIKDYVQNNKRHTAYEVTVSISEHLRFHIDGFEYDPLIHQLTFNPFTPKSVFDRLIGERRPSESAYFLQYRKSIFVSVTEEPTFKVLSSLKKIVKSEDWKIDYSRSETPPSIPDDEQLEVYAEQKFPKFGSVTGWVFTIGLKEMLRDPNGVFVVFARQEKTNEFRKPEIHFIPSERVWDWTDEHIVYRTDKVVSFTREDKTVGSAFTLIVLTEDKISEWVQISDDTFREDIIIEHNFGEFPAVRAGGMIKEVVNGWPIYDSFIKPMLPRLDEASREYSDLQATVVQHNFPTLWYVASQDCQKCNGTGSIHKSGEITDCDKCDGEGGITKGPYKDFVVKKPGVGDENPITPPGGYITKDIEITKLQNERVDQHIFKALSSVNHEFLAKIPLSESGKAKEVDRDEANNYVFSVAFHLVGMVLNPIYRFINNYRNTIVEKNREKLLPKINVPERFDLLSPDNLMHQIQMANEAKVDPSIVSVMQLDFINKKFKESPNIRKKLKIISDIDPFPGNDNTEVSEMLLSGAISQEDAIMSIYMESFYNELSEEEEKFIDKTREEQRKSFEKKMLEKVAELTPEPVEPVVEPPPVEE